MGLRKPGDTQRGPEQGREKEGLVARKRFLEAAAKAGGRKGSGAGGFPVRYRLAGSEQVDAGMCARMDTRLAAYSAG